MALSPPASLRFVIPALGTMCRDISRASSQKGGHVYWWKSIDQKAATDAKTGRSRSLPLRKAFFGGFWPAMPIKSAPMLQISA
jgi:hypothetical protein